MSSEKMREEFDTWHSDQVARLLEHGEPTAAKVWTDFKSLLWTTWQASRAAIEVELPPSPYMPDSDPDSMSGYEIGEAQGRCDMWAACRAAIESLGLKVRT